MISLILRDQRRHVDLDLGPSVEQHELHFAHRLVVLVIRLLDRWSGIMNMVVTMGHIIAVLDVTKIAVGPIAGLLGQDLTGTVGGPTTKAEDLAVLG